MKQSQKLIVSVVVRAAALTALVLGVVGVTSVLADTPDAVKPDAIKIGWIGPLTGNASVLGIDSLAAVKMAVEEANAADGAKIELLVEDDQYDTAKAVTAYAKLVAQGAKALVLMTYGGVFATAPRAVNDGVIVIDALDCNEDIAKLPENTFCIATKSETVGEVLAEDIGKKSLTPVAVLYDEKNPFMELVQRVLRSKYGSAPNYFGGIDQASADFKSEMARIKAAAPKSIVLLGHDPMGQAMREARAVGITAPFYTVGTITSPNFQALAGDAAEGALVAFWEAPDSAQAKTFMQTFSGRTGKKPTLELATTPSYDAANILIAAVRAAGPAAGAAAVREQLLKVRDYPGVSGQITMDSDGAVRTIVEHLYRFEKGVLIHQ